MQRCERLNNGGKKVNLKGYTRHKNIKLVVVRISKDNTLLDSKPCKMCLNMIKKAKIKTIYYSDSLGNIVRDKLSNMTEHECTTSKGVKFVEKHYGNYHRSQIRRLYKRLSI